MTGMTASAPRVIEAIVPSLPDGWQVVSYVSLADGTLAILGADADLRAEWRRDDAGIMLGDPGRVAATARARLWTYDGNALADGPCFPLGSPFPIIDRFPDGRWLVGSARAWDEVNARIVSSDGEELRRIRLGDGIQHLKIDDTAHIWVGWFDEGVCGNQGWRLPGVEWPPSSYGLAAFDEHGNLVARAAGSASDAIIVDCYALNLVGGTAYACTYMDFPILSISVSEPARWWPTELSGPRALAISRPYVLAAGGYAERGDRVVLLRLEEGRARTIKEWHLPFKLGYPDSVDFVDGRADALHVVQDGVWYRWRIDDFLADVSS
jgi:hypothetical protein